MKSNLQAIEHGLDSPNKEVRLRSLKLMLTHPEATPLQIVKCLTSSDNRNFEFMKLFELDSAMRRGKKRLCDVNNPQVFEYIETFHKEDPIKNSNLVAHVLECIKTPESIAILKKLRQGKAFIRQQWFDHAIRVIEGHLKIKSEQGSGGNVG